MSLRSSSRGPSPTPGLRVVALAAVAFATMLGASRATAQGNTGTVAGVVADSATKAPLSGVEVIVAGEGSAGTRNTRTGINGRYSLTGVPAGQVMVSVRLVGYAPRALRLTVRTGETVTADFALPAQTARLDQVVVTGTGGVAQRRAVGNVIESIDAKEVMANAAPRSV